MMQGLELLWLAKMHVSTLNIEKIKLIAIAIIKLHLSEGISQLVIQSVISRKFLKIISTWWKNLWLI